MRAHVEVVAARSSSQDRARAIERATTLVVVLADGAGGTSNGAKAAQAIVDAVSEAPDADACALLEHLDLDAARLHGGQSTAVIVSITDAGIAGASVGDSGAWTISPRGDVTVLTEHQQRKPLVGDDIARGASRLSEANGSSWDGRRYPRT